MPKARQRTNWDTLGQPTSQKLEPTAPEEETPDGLWRRVAELYKTPSVTSEEATRKRLARAKKRGLYFFRRGPDGRQEILCDRGEPDRPLPRGDAILRVGKGRPASENPEINELRTLVAKLVRMPHLDDIERGGMLHFPLAKAEWERLTYLVRQYPEEKERTLPNNRRIFFRPEQEGLAFSATECRIIALRTLV